jgi:hypothetical protein
MTTVSKYFVIVLVLSAVVLAQSTAKKNQTNPQTSASAPAASGNGKGQKDAAAKASGHPSNMSGNHKDMMMSVAADKNQGSTPHSGNMVGNHKDVMMSAAPAPAASGTTQPAARPLPPPGVRRQCPTSPLHRILILNAEGWSAAFEARNHSSFHHSIVPLFHRSGPSHHAPTGACDNRHRNKSSCERLTPSLTRSIIAPILPRPFPPRGSLSPATPDSVSVRRVLQVVARLS